MKRNLDILFSVVLAVAVAVVAVIAGKGAFDRGVRDERRTMMSVAVDDVSRRLSESRLGLANIKQLYDESALAAARTFALIVAKDPSVLRDRKRFEALAGVLGVEELHVSDAAGRLIASVPAEYTGYEMASKEQSAAFMPAITSRSFELVQAPMRKGSDGKYFQYAGVARIDEPGIVQIGISPGRLDMATSLADVEKIATSSRLGNGGRVRIRTIREEERLGAARSRYTQVWGYENGERIAALEADCGSYRITVTMPLYGWVLSDDAGYSAVCGLLHLFVILLGVLLAFSLMFRGLRGFVDSFRRMMSFRDFSVKTLSDAGFVPIMTAGVLVFVVLMLGTWYCIHERNRGYFTEMLNHGAADLEEDIMDSADGMLFFVGSAITEHYRTPEKLAEVDIKELMHRYGIDELNIVNEKGVVIQGDIANVGFDFHSNANTREFLVLLDSEKFLVQRYRAAIEDPSLVRKYAGIAFPEHRGFVQIGYDKKHLEKDLDFSLEGIIKDWTVGESGFFIIARRANGEIVSCGIPEWKHECRGAATLSGAGISVLDLPDDPSRPFKQRLFGRECLCVSRLVGDYHRIVVAIPEEEFRQSVRFSMLIAGGGLFTVLLFAVLVTLWVTNANRRLNLFIEEDAKRREQDMLVSKTIQTSSLPVVFPDNENFAISAKMITAREVGGDFYDFYRVPSGRTFFLVADTSGKGIPAAMFMMKAKAIIKACVFEYDDFAEAAVQMNNRLAENNDANMFVTAWFGLLDETTGEVEFVNCGHNPPLIRRADGSAEWLRTRSGMTLAAMEGMRYRVGRFRLGKGDVLLLYTDGVTEAMNPEGELYGEPRLENLVRESEGSRLLQSVQSDVFAFAAGAEQADDITMLTLEVRGER